MTETSKVKTDDESNGRTRFSLKPYAYLLQDSDDSDEAENSDELDVSDFSEDEWNKDSKGKRRKKFKNIDITPPRTLKKKLADKMKALRKSTVKTSNKVPELVESSKPKSDEVNVKAETSITLEQPKIESENEVKLEKTDGIVKSESITSSTASSAIETKCKVAECIVSGSESKETLPVVAKVETPKKNEPVVLTYSTVKNSSNISPFLLNNDPTTELASPPFSSTYSSISTPSKDSPSFLPSPSNAPVVTSSFSSVPSSVSSVPSPAAVSTNSNTSSPVPRIRIRSNLQASPGFRDSLTLPCRPTAPPIIPSLPRPRVRAPNPRCPQQRVRAPRAPSSLPRSSASTVNQNRRGKPVSQPIPVGNTRPLGGVRSPVSPRTGANTRTIPADVRTTPVGARVTPVSTRTTPVSARTNPIGAKTTPVSVRSTPVSSRTTPVRAVTTPNLKDSNSLKNIASTGTVIYNGSNSVTITPRKVRPEQPPVQRKLFKNEIEGIIAVRHENGVLKYVINLANGTHMPLTDHQVNKLREQNGGSLPTKLKIPVPSDVAAKIEPIYLIED